MSELCESLDKMSKKCKIALKTPMTQSDGNWKHVERGTRGGRVRDGRGRVGGVRGRRPRGGGVGGRVLSRERDNDGAAVLGGE